jgi:hypothetical protein
MIDQQQKKKTGALETKRANQKYHQNKGQPNDSLN